MLAHFNSGSDQTTIKGTLHEDLQIFLHVEMTEWGIPLSFMKVKGQILVNVPACYAMHTFPN